MFCALLLFLYSALSSKEGDIYRTSVERRCTKERAEWDSAPCQLDIPRIARAGPGPWSSGMQFSGRFATGATAAGADRRGLLLPRVRAFFARAFAAARAVRVRARFQRLKAAAAGQPGFICPASGLSRLAPRALRVGAAPAALCDGHSPHIWKKAASPSENWLRTLIDIHGHQHVCWVVLGN